MSELSFVQAEEAENVFCPDSVNHNFDFSALITANIINDMAVNSSIMINPQITDRLLIGKNRNAAHTQIDLPHGKHDPPFDIYLQLNRIIFFCHGNRYFHGDIYFSSGDSQQYQ